MAGPWEEYQSKPVESGPWSDYQESATMPAPSKEAPAGQTSRLGQGILDYAANLGEAAGALFSAPGKAASYYAEKAGLDLTRPTVGLEPLSVRDMLEPTGTTGQAIQDITNTVAPTGGLLNLGRTLKTIRQAPSLEPLQPSFTTRGYRDTAGPPPPSGTLVDTVPGYSQTELLTEPKGEVSRPPFGEVTHSKWGTEFRPYEGKVPSEFAPVEVTGPTGTITQHMVPPIRLKLMEERALRPQADEMDDGLPKSVKANLPPAWKRAFTSGMIELAKTHPAGEAASESWLRMRDNIEQKTIQGLNQWERAMDTIWGRRIPGSPKTMDPLHHYETQNVWNIGKNDIDEIVDYLYSEGRIKPKGYDMMGSPGMSREAMRAQKIVETADAYFAATKGASEHPGVRERTYFDPITMQDLPLGEPSMFFSHLPLGKKAEGLQMRAYNEGYARYKSAHPDKTRADYDVFMKRHTTEVRGFAGIERARLFDAEEGGRPSINLKKNGYDTDPRRVLFNYLRGAYGAGERTLMEPVWARQMDQILEGNTDRVTDAWVRTIFDRMRETDFEIADRIVGEAASKINNITNTALLQASTPMQINQAMYIIQRAGLTNFIKALGSKGSYARYDASGATYADYLSTLSIGTHDPFAKALQAELTMNGFTGMDRVLRGIAGKTGDIQLQQYYARLLQNPADKLARGVIKELGLDPDKMLTMGIQDTDRLAAAKRFADETQGRKDLGGLPLWATDNQPFKRVLLNLKNFMIINNTNLKRDLIDAHRHGIPATHLLKRAGQGVVAAGVLGEITKDILYGITSFQSPFEDKRTPKAIRDLFGASYGRVVDDIITGYSSLGLALLVTLAQQDKLSMFKQVAPPALSLAIDAVTDPAKTATRALGGPAASKTLFPPKEGGEMQMRDMSR